MELIYHPNHNERYGHIHILDRWKYPDEIELGHPPLVLVIKRVKNFSELKWEDVPDGISPCLAAKDVPFTKGCIR